MCGRTSCALAPAQVTAACSYTPRGQQASVQPAWSPRSLPYFPAYNVGPHKRTPVLVQDSCNAERSLQVMKWGLLPSWHKGDPKTFKLSTINCRSDTLLDKATFRKPLEKGQRCVVLADGFYEWANDAQGKKQPYFVHFPEREDGQPRLLTMAGVYDCWRHAEPLASELHATDLKHELAEGNDAAEEETPGPVEQPQELWSYSIITVEAAPSLKWLHDRMPAILESEDEIATWLNPSTALPSALALLRPHDRLQWHAVDPMVGNIRHNDPKCVLKYEPPSPSKAPNPLMKWLKTAASSPVKRKAEHNDAAAGEKRQCAVCLEDNHEAASSCNFCGTAIGAASLECPACTFINPPGSPCCTVCGGALLCSDGAPKRRRDDLTADCDVL